MGRENLERLYREIEKTNDAKATELKSALKAFIEQTREVYTYDKDGYLPPITAEKKDALIGHYKALAQTLDKFIENEKEYDPKLVELVDKFAADASWDFNSLLQYDPAKGLKSTATLEEENQPLRLKEPSEVEVIGGDSKTMKVAGFLDNKGNELRGVCMDTHSPTPTKNVMKGLSELANSIKDGEFKKSFLRFVNDLPNMTDQNLDALFNQLYSANLAEYRISPKNFASKASAQVFFLLRATAPEHSSVRTSDVVAEGLAALSRGKWTVDIIRENMDKTALKKFAKLLDRQECPLSTTDCCYLAEGSRISNGSIGVYIMANLLGVAELVPPTTRATLVDKDGKETEVIFMYEATGVDYDRAEDSLKKAIGPYCIENQKDVNHAGLKAGMDMQTLSNMCNLFDREVYNIILQFNKDGAWIGGQLIDTDQSFSTIKFRDICRAVTEPMAQKLMELNKNPEMLKFALWCCTPRDKRDATAKRIRREVQRIHKSELHYKQFDCKRRDKADNPYGLDPEDIRGIGKYVRVIPVDELNRVKEGDIPYLGMITESLWNHVFSFEDVFLQKAQEKPKDLDLTKHYCKLPVKPEDLTGTKRRTNAVGLLASQRELVNNQTLLDEKTDRIFSWFRSSSEQYCAMQKTLDDLLSYQEGLLQRLKDPKTAQKNPMTSMELIEIKEQNMELEECAWDYLYTKFGTVKDSPQKKRKLIEDYRDKKAAGNFRSDYEKECVDAALKVLDIAQKGQNIDDEKDVAAYNTVQSMERERYSKAMC